MSEINEKNTAFLKVLRTNISKNTTKLSKQVGKKKYDGIYCNKGNVRIESLATAVGYYSIYIDTLYCC